MNEKLSSWSCKGCTNTCLRLLNDGEVYTYCRAVIEHGQNRTEWQGNHLACLDYTEDINATDKQVRLWMRRER